MDRKILIYEWKSVYEKILNIGTYKGKAKENKITYAIAMSQTS